MRTSAFFGAKTFGFFEVYGVSARTRGVGPVRGFCGQGGRGQFFTILCGRLLWTAPYKAVTKLKICDSRFFESQVYQGCTSML